MSYEHNIIVITNNNEIIYWPQLLPTMIDGLPLWEYIEKEVEKLNIGVIDE